MGSGAGSAVCCVDVAGAFRPFRRRGAALLGLGQGCEKGCRDNYGGSDQQKQIPFLHMILIRVENIQFVSAAEFLGAGYGTSHSLWSG